MTSFLILGFGCVEQQVGVERVVMGDDTIILKKAFTYGCGVAPSRGEILRTGLGSGMLSVLNSLRSALVG